MSLTRGDAHANSRRWLTSRRHSLFSDDDQLSQATSLVLPDRRDQLENINSIRYDVEHFLENESLTNGNKENLDVQSWRFYRSSTRLPVSGKVARVALLGGFRLGAGWHPRLERLVLGKMTDIIF